jgi:hypothetical protein
MTEEISLQRHGEHRESDPQISQITFRVRMLLLSDGEPLSHGFRRKPYPPTASFS